MTDDLLEALALEINVVRCRTGNPADGVFGPAAAEAVLALLQERGLKIIEKPNGITFLMLKHGLDVWFDMQPLYPGAQP
jgi:peptidoglycan hydrolase-like protein with peptidoglycan-binding domain